MMVNLSEGVKPENALMIPEPMKVVVGERYEFMYQGNMINVTLKKIVTDSQHQIVGFILTKSFDRGLLRHFREQAITVTKDELKQRLVSGGLKEAIL